MGWPDFIFWWLAWPIKIAVSLIVGIALLLLLNNILLWLLRSTVQTGMTVERGNQLPPGIVLHTVSRAEESNWWKRRSLAASVFLTTGGYLHEPSPLRLAFRFTAWFWFRKKD